ncbi:MAG: hypothetical protein EBS48_11340, partial [Actinobacteria bacterium]|nr:hypothetical protein [Actinomycetota bacterium]
MAHSVSDTDERGRISQVTQVFLPQGRRRYPTSDLKRLMKQKLAAEMRADAAEAELNALRTSRNRLLQDRACGGCREQELLRFVDKNRQLSAFCDAAIAGTAMPRARVPSTVRVPTNVPVSTRVPANLRVPVNTRVPVSTRVPANLRVPVNT